MRLKAELWDKVQYLFRYYYDRMIHAVYYLDGNIDREKFKKSISIILQKVPVLRSRYVASKINPYWIVEEGDFTNEVVSFCDTDNLESDLDEFITSRFESNRAPQIRIRVLNYQGKDTIGFLVNHQCMDGADCKVLVNKIVEIYNDLLNNGDGNIAVKSGSRANEQVYSTMTAEDRKIAKGMYKNVSKTKHRIAFPFTQDNADVKPMIVRYKIDSEMFDKLKAYGKKHNATINDVILAAYFRAIYKTVDIKEDQNITIPCMTDLRRHIKGSETAGFTNLTCLIPCSIDSIGPTFSDTLSKVCDEMNRHKNDKFVGLSPIPLLELAYKVAPSSISELLIRARYTNPYIGMSNVGIIDESKLKWGNIKTIDAFMTGSIKYKPYMQVALTCFIKMLTLTICNYGNNEDKKIIEKFFKTLDKELKSLC